MTEKRAIDKQREAAITLTIGDDDDKSAIQSSLSTSNALYIIKENGVYKIQLADDIDPDRTNPNIPNVNQKVLSAGGNNEVVARILLTAKCLFDENNAIVRPFVSAFLEQSIDLTKHVLELHEMIFDLKEKITHKEKFFEEQNHKPNTYSLPAVPDLDKDLHNIIVKADKAKDNILSLYRLNFLPEAKKKPKIDEYDAAIRTALSSKADIISSWDEIKRILNLLRNIRNSSEHRRDGNQLILTDFEMKPDGSVTSPTLEIQHKDTPIEQVQVVDFLSFIEDVVLDHAEESIVIIRLAALLDRNPFNEHVGKLTPEDRRHPLVRYCRTINMGGNIQILG